jgi:pteridine reductase
MQENLEGKKVLITGAAKRIGRQIALALVAEGAEIVIHYNHSEKEAQEFCNILTESGGRAWIVKADFDNPQEFQTLISAAAAKAGSLDFLINSAAIFSLGAFKNMDFENFVHNIQINAWVPYVLSRDFANIIGRGQIINILDTRISTIDLEHAPYYLSKRLFADMTRMMAIEFAPSIKVNAISPGLILPPEDKDKNYINELAENIPLKRYGDPSDISDAVIFLLKSTFVTGQILNVDGGQQWTA